MSYLTDLLKGYVFEKIKNPVYKDGKPVGILCDCGHGLEQYTPGKRSPDGSLIEGRWNREMVALLVPVLRSIGFDARTIVTEDEDIPLNQRVYRANQVMAREKDKRWYYLSVHINAAPKESCDSQGWCDKASGFCSYVSLDASVESCTLAKKMVEAAHRLGLKGTRSVPRDGYWKAGYYVLRNTYMPAILNENLFMTNRKECEFLKSPKGKELLSTVCVEALCDYFGVPYAHIEG